MGGVTCDIIDICALLASEGGLLKDVPVSCTDTYLDNCDAGPCSCNPDAHYIWLLGPDWYVYSTCVGIECDANYADGFQGIYPRDECKLTEASIGNYKSKTKEAY